MHKQLPKHLKSYKQTPIFTEKTLPDAFKKNHSTKKGVWGLIHVQKGKLNFTIEHSFSENTDESTLISKGDHGIIEPEVLHRVNFVEAGEFFVEFYK